MGGLVVQGLIAGLFLVAGVAGLVHDIRQRRVPTRIRVAQLRETLQHADPGEEILIRPAASGSLSVEMITEVAADEGFRFRRDTTMSINQRAYKAMVFASTDGGHGG